MPGLVHPHSRMHTHMYTHTQTHSLSHKHTHTHTHVKTSNSWWSEGSHGTTGKNSPSPHVCLQLCWKCVALLPAESLCQKPRSKTSEEAVDWWGGDYPASGTQPSSRCRVLCSKMALHSLHRTPPLKSTSIFLWSNITEKQNIHKSFRGSENVGWTNVQGEYSDLDLEESYSHFTQNRGFIEGRLFKKYGMDKCLLSIWNFTATFIFKIVTSTLCKSICLLIMHQHTKCGCKRLNSLEDTRWRCFLF